MEKKCVCSKNLEKKSHIHSHEFIFYSNVWVFFLGKLLGIGRVALDTRLGCLEPNLDPKSEPQQIINAAKYALRNVATLEVCVGWDTGRLSIYSSISSQ